MGMPNFKNRARWIWIAAACGVVAAAALLLSQYGRPAGRPAAVANDHGNEHAHGPHAGHDHGHDHAAEALTIELSDRALRNIGLGPEGVRPITLETFQRSITVPAMVVTRPGRTEVQVTTPMTAVVTAVYAFQGEAVEPGALLFELRLTHEDLVKVQTEFLKALGELDVENREIERLRDVTESGAIAGKALLDRQYARDKLQAQIKAEREALRLHGLSERQVDQIATERRLLRELRIYAPGPDSESQGPEELKLGGAIVRPASYQPGASEEDAATGKSSPLILQELRAQKGQAVVAGDTLCVLADYSELFIEGQAFDQDAGLISRALENGWKASAVFEEPGHRSWVVDSLEIAYLANKIDTDSRILHFYVRLPNEITADTKQEDGKRFVTWKYRPGQRLQLRIPVEEWKDQIVLPVDAVAREGAESYVFRRNGKKFERVPVHVKHRDPLYVVLENDGSVYPGDPVALRGAHQLLLAIKNKSGGAVDPHAGHHH